MFAACCTMGTRNAGGGWDDSKAKRIDSGVLPDVLPETEEIRTREWKVAPIPPAVGRWIAGHPGAVGVSWADPALAARAIP